MKGRRSAICPAPQVVPILRAGLVILEQAGTVIPISETYHLGMARDEETLEVSEAYLHSRFVLQRPCCILSSKHFRRGGGHDRWDTLPSLAPIAR